MNDRTNENPTADDVTRLLNIGVTYKVREEKMGEGTLRIYDTYVGGDLAASVFTLESLAHVMGLAMSTMDGRYKRARLARWMVPIPSMAGRPMRGFPYQLLEPVITAIEHPRAYIGGDASGSRVMAQTHTKQLSALTPEYFCGERYYTYPSLARSFGLSETTVRTKMSRSGLARRFENLASPPQGGRPKRGIHERHMAEVKLALHDGAQFLNKYDSAVYRATGEMSQARQQVRDAVVPHTPPARGSSQAWDPYELAPVTKAPVNSVNPHSPEIVQLMAELDELSAQFDAAQNSGNTPVEPQEPAPTMLTESQAEKAEREAQAQTRRAMVGPHRDQLVNDTDEPTAETLADTVYALDLHGQEAQDFIDSVKQGREARKTTGNTA